MPKKEHSFIPYLSEEFDENEMIERSKEFHKWSEKRRSLRHFSSRQVPKEVMENIILTASTAPSGANRQPWVFCLISNAELKSKIRKSAEQEEEKSYKSRMNAEWLEAIKPLGTTWIKEFIDVAPWIVVVLKKPYDLDENGDKKINYFVSESVGLASGFLLMAIHNAGLVALTHTPSPMNFIAKALNRPENERPFLLIPVGFAARDAKVPDLKRKSKDDVIEYYD
jgi:nitroreductase